MKFLGVGILNVSGILIFIIAGMFGGLELRARIPLTKAAQLTTTRALDRTWPQFHSQTLACISKLLGDGQIINVTNHRSSLLADGKHLQLLFRKMVCPGSCFQLSLTSPSPTELDNRGNNETCFLTDHGILH